MFINLLAFFFLSTYLLYLMKLLYFNVCLWSLCIIICIFISFITLHKTNKIIHNIKYNCNKNNLSEPFEPYNDSYTNGFSVNNVLCSNLDVSQNLNTTADIKSTGNVIVKSIDNYKVDDKTLLQALYPIGSIYMSMNSTDPATFIGGTWVLIQNRFLLSVGTDTDSKTEGGSDTITTDHLPSHSHSIDITSESSGAHEHNVVHKWKDGNKWYKRYFKNKSQVCTADCTYDDGDLRFMHNANKENETVAESAGSHTHKVDGDTESTGSGKSYKPPYITCYIWYRTN